MFEHLGKNEQGVLIGLIDADSVGTNGTQTGNALGT